MPVIRPAIPADEGFLVGLTSRLADFDLPPWRTSQQIADADLGLLREALHRPTAQTAILVAEAPPGTPAGFALISTKTDYFTHQRHAHIEALAVKRGCEGQGLGRALLEAAENWAAERGDTQITLNAYWQNSRARALYDRLEWEPETIHYRKGLARPEERS